MIADNTDRRKSWPFSVIARGIAPKQSISCKPGVGFWIATAAKGRLAMTGGISAAPRKNIVLIVLFMSKQRCILRRPQKIYGDAMSRSIARFLFAAALAVLAGPASAQLLTSGDLLVQADALMWQEKYEEASEAAQEALRLAEQTAGENGLRLVKPLKTLAMLDEFQHRYAEAAEHYERALKILKALPEPEAGAIAELEAALGKVRLEQQETGRHRHERGAAKSLGSSAGSHGARGGGSYEASGDTAAQAAPSDSPQPAPQGAPPGSTQAAPPQTLPFFPWPPPAASAFYVLPRETFARNTTVGEVGAAIISALERAGYAEHSFFQTERGGVALVTKLERIDDDGTPEPDAGRWPGGFETASSGLMDLLRGLFYVKAGHYRVIVFILRDLPFRQSAEGVSGEKAKAWLREGLNALPEAFAVLPFRGDSTCTAVIYEFESDGTAVRTVESSHATGKQHLERAGLLAALR